MKFKIKALRGDREVEVDLELYAHSSEREDLAIRMIGGPTGYESFYVEDFLKHRREDLTWLACMGTGGYDRMVVPHEQMKNAFLAFGIKT